ncbi:GNAT family acetyltransferase [Fulvitalea axinellae]|uniref:GNAT family acetyltransferase n=1 Tax=Fulvitalea axinellae TaxID=1182444 RepID=A0AAU9D9N9_9BACT|nr:GNAT family acetyltransferase [Fulvitalea axinellae]
MVTVKKVMSDPEMAESMTIRNSVFLADDQSLANEAFDLASVHFIAYDSQETACGTARWRFVDDQIHLEKFAVLKEYRTKGVGTALVKAVLEDIRSNPHTSGFPIVLACRPESVFVYQKFGFTKNGDPFLDEDQYFIPMIKSE